MSKESYFLASTGSSGYLGNLEKRGIDPNLKVLWVKADGKYWTWLLMFEWFLEVRSGDSI